MVDNYPEKRQIVLDPDTKTKLENLAWVQRDSTGELVRQILQDYTAGKYADVEIVPLPEGAKRVRFSLRVDDELWENVGDATWKAGSNRSNVVRSVAMMLTKDIPLDRKLVQR